jgi:hypothetical protein
VAKLCDPHNFTAHLKEIKTCVDKFTEGSARTGLLPVESYCSCDWI